MKRFTKTKLEQALTMLQRCLDEGMDWTDAEWAVRDRLELSSHEWYGVVDAYDGVGE